MPDRAVVEPTSFAIKPCGGCGDETQCVWVDGWLKSWRCPACVAEHWTVATEEGLRKVIDLTAELAELVAIAMEYRYFPDHDTAKTLEPDLLRGAVRAHWIKRDLAFMAQSRETVSGRREF